MFEIYIFLIVCVYYHRKQTLQLSENGLTSKQIYMIKENLHVHVGLFSVTLFP